MGYSGYTQVLCKDGHLYNYDCYDPNCPLNYEDSDSWHCPECGSRCVWHNDVDQTNDDGNPVLLWLLTPAVKCECPICGDTHTKHSATYKIPDALAGGWHHPKVINPKPVWTRNVVVQIDEGSFHLMEGKAVKDETF